MTQQSIHRIPRQEKQTRPQINKFTIEKELNAKTMISRAQFTIDQVGQTSRSQYATKRRKKLNLARKT